MVSYFQRLEVRPLSDRASPASQEAFKPWDAVEEKTKKVSRRPRWNTTIDISKKANQPQDPQLYFEMLRELEQEQAYDFKQCQFQGAGFLCDGARGHMATSSKARPHSAPTTRRPTLLKEASNPDTFALPSPSRPQTAPQLRAPARNKSVGPANANISHGDEQSSKPKKLQRTRSQGNLAPSKCRREKSPPRLMDSTSAATERSQYSARSDADTLRMNMPCSAFAQRVEDNQVRCSISKLKTEARVGKDALRKIDIWCDTSLFDLRVNHNSAARKRTEKQKKQREDDLQPSFGRSRTGHRIGPDHPKWKQLGAVDKVTNLWHVLDMGIRLAEEKGKTEVDDEFEIPGTPSPEACDGMQPSLRRSDAGGLHKGTIAQGIESISQALLKKTKRGSLSKVSPDVKCAAVNLLEFLVERCTNIADFLHLLDVKNTGRISKRNWETSLMAMGCVSDEPARFFKALDAESTGELLVDDLVQALKEQMPALSSRHSGALYRNQGGALSLGYASLAESSIGTSRAISPR